MCRNSSNISAGMKFWVEEKEEEVEDHEALEAKDSEERNFLGSRGFS